MFFFFPKINTFCMPVFFPLLFSFPSMHRNGTWAKLNARHLGTQIWWLLNDSFFHSFITARWRYWCREKTVNSCYTFLSKPRRQTMVNHVSYGFNPTLSQTFFFSFWTFLKNFFFQWSQLFELLFLTHAGRYRLHRWVRSTLIVIALLAVSYYWSIQSYFMTVE